MVDFQGFYQRFGSVFPIKLFLDGLSHGSQNNSFAIVSDLKKAAPIDFQVISDTFRKHYLTL